EGRPRALAKLIGEILESLAEHSLARDCGAKHMGQPGLIAGDISLSFQALQQRQDGGVSPAAAALAQTNVQLPDGSRPGLPDRFQNVQLGLAGRGPMRCHGHSISRRRLLQNVVRSYYNV